MLCLTTRAYLPIRVFLRLQNYLSETTWVLAYAEMTHNRYFNIIYLLYSYITFFIRLLMRGTSLTGLFPLWTLLGCLLAWMMPGWFSPLKPAIVPLPGLVMFGMGMTLTGRDFLNVLRCPVHYWQVSGGVNPCYRYRENENGYASTKMPIHGQVHP